MWFSKFKREIAGYCVTKDFEEKEIVIGLFSVSLQNGSTLRVEEEQEEGKRRILKENLSRS